MERDEPLNGDGFGVGWYAHDIDPFPCVFTSTTPAWSNRNLSRLAEKIRSTCVFAHVRAASPDSSVSQVNCHPFQYQQFLWMQNGWIPDFSRVRRRLRDRLSDEFYNMIQGTTDTEHAFALFLHRLGKHIHDYNLEVLCRTLVRTVRDLTKLHRDSESPEPAFFNFALTDGHNILATRCVSDATVVPQTLYITTGRRFGSADGAYDMTPADGHVEAAIIASEPLTPDREDWTPVPVNHMVVISPELHVRFVALD
ncbi:MAG: class II glutamine amidotransferase [Gammaproteobacteria bacterium]|nr:class II glutamine amidotransferase [Gammaproteobacteria bacterium]